MNVYIKIFTRRFLWKSKSYESNSYKKSKILNFAEKYCCINIEESYVFDVYVVIILHYAKYYGWDAHMSLISV